MALPTGKSLPHFLPHPLPTLVSRKLTDYPFTGRLILNGTNMGRKLHFLVSIIDTKDAVICKAQRKGPSVCPRRRGGVWEGRSPVRLGLSVSVCPSAFLSEATCPGGLSLSPWPWKLGPCDLRQTPMPVREAGRVQGPAFQGSRPRARLCHQLSFSFLPEALTTEKPGSLALGDAMSAQRPPLGVALEGMPRGVSSVRFGLSAPSPLSPTL